MGIHLAWMILFLIAEIFLLKISSSAVHDYKSIVGELGDDDSVISTAPYGVYEDYISKQFNKFFFGAISNCSSKSLSPP